VSRFKFAVLTVGEWRGLRYRRCGNVPHQIRRSDCWRFAEVTLPAVAMGCCVFNSLIFKFLYEKTAVGEDGGFCVTEKFDNSGIYGKSLLYQP
jgi:hypothetical protein